MITVSALGFGATSSLDLPSNCFGGDSGICYKSTFVFRSTNSDWTQSKRSETRTFGRLTRCFQLIEISLISLSCLSLFWPCLSISLTTIYSQILISLILRRTRIWIQESLRFYWMRFDFYLVKISEKTFLWNWLSVTTRWSWCCLYLINHRHRTCQSWMTCSFRSSSWRH